MSVCPGCGLDVVPVQQGVHFVCPACGWWPGADTAYVPTAPAPIAPMAMGEAGPGGVAVTSLVFGILAVCFSILGLILGPVALITGGIGLRRASGTPARAGKGMSITGLVLGGVGTVLGLFWVFMIAMMFIGGALSASHLAVGYEEIDPDDTYYVDFFLGSDGNVTVEVEAQGRPVSVAIYASHEPDGDAVLVMSDEGALITEKLELERGPYHLAIRCDALVPCGASYEVRRA